ncbi:hypothetical protein LOTGIDRAFT_182816, partial [Lottia gigantea]
MFRSLPKLMVLKIENCQISQLPELAFAGLNKLEELTIKHTSLSLIHENSFRPLPKLRLLELVASGVRHMPNLCNIKTLRTLNISHNDISSYDKTGVRCDDSGDNIPNLEVLDVSYNSIEHIPVWFGDSFPNLKRLTSSDNNISVIEQNTLNKLTQLMWLDLSNNSMTEFERDVIRNCSNLQVLALGSNPVETLPQGIIANHTKLSHLFLHNLSLTDNIWNEFLLLKRLGELSLHSNRISRINNQVMERMPLLIELDLSNNSITYFNIFTFKDQYRLRNLNLSNNLIQSIPKQAFKFVHSLKSLDLSKNNITDFSKSAFKGLRKLKLVDLSQNSLLTLQPEVFVALPALRTLNLSHNTLTVYPSFHDMKSVDILDLSHNNLSAVDITTFYGLSAVTDLNLRHNQLDYIPHGVFQHCRKLETLCLSDNDIRDISAGGFLKLENLLKLDLSFNKLTETVTVLSNLPNLMELDLSFNFITKVYRGQFPDSVQKIDLSRNAINYIAPFTFRTMHQLKNVRIDFNNLTSLPVLSVEISRNAHPKPTFYISANPLSCDCSLSWLKGVMDGDAGNVDLYPNIVDIVLVLCTTVYDSDPKPFRVVPRSHFLCSYREKCEYNCPCCGVEQCFCKYQCPESCSCLMSDDKTNIHKVHCENRNLTSVPESIPKAVTELLLDGNNITSIPDGAFIGLDNVKTIYLNNSNVRYFGNASFQGLNDVVDIYLNENALHTIPSFTFNALNKLERIYLNNNDIQTIKKTAFQDLLALKLLSLANNSIHTIPLDFVSNVSNKTIFSLGGNPWSCGLKFVCSFSDFVTTNSGRIKDISNVKCARKRAESDDIQYSISLLDERVKKQCGLNKTEYINSTISKTKSIGKDIHITALIIISIATGIIAGVLLIAYWKRDLIKVWCFIKYGWRVHNNADDEYEEIQRPFDAFLSYSNKDQKFVIDHLAPRLEHGERKFKLCLHYRDFPVGACIAETIVRSIECSKRTIMLISDNFLQSEWCRYEFQTAHHQVLTEKKNRLIIVLLHDINQNKLDSQLKLYFKTRTYLKFNDPWFWDKLYYAMPN